MVKTIDTDKMSVKELRSFKREIGRVIREKALGLSFPEYSVVELEISADWKDTIQRTRTVRGTIISTRVSPNGRVTYLVEILPEFKELAVHIYAVSRIYSCPSRCKLAPLKYQVIPKLTSQEV